MCWKPASFSKLMERQMSIKINARLMQHKLLVTKAATKFCTHNEPAAPSLSLLMLLAEFFSDKYVIGA